MPLTASSSRSPPSRTTRSSTSPPKCAAASSPSPPAGAASSSPSAPSPRAPPPPRRAAAASSSSPLSWRSSPLRCGYLALYLAFYINRFILSGQAVDGGLIIVHKLEFDLIEIPAVQLDDVARNLALHIVSPPARPTHLQRPALSAQCRVEF
mmetsp:Transcript_24781/g.80143  ORF Transcript_24781/g.80143 Transcript_24781/m.80143 type:complete len:152 (-) Transcript_24781:949-1404(-)